MSSYSDFFKKPSTPALIAGLILLIGYILSTLFQEQITEIPVQLVGILLSTILLVVVYRRKLIKIPNISEKAIKLIRYISLISITSELIYFGFPLLGSVPYNEFGWPVIHHLSVTTWVLVLFGNRRKNLDLCLTILIAVVIFNRQLALYAILSYLLTTKLTKKQTIIGGVILTIIILYLGVIRNNTLGVDTSNDTTSTNLENSPLFFIYLFLLGPLHTSLSMSSEMWDNYLSNYWNTLPGWMIPSNLFDLQPAVSFILFYGIFSLISYFLSKIRCLHIKIFGLLIQVYLYFSFFSNVLISTSIIANYLILLMAILLFPIKKKNERSDIIT
jgi:hypothetical protein